MTQSFSNLEQIGESLIPLLRTARIPGAAMAVVSRGEVVFERGYGCRDLSSGLPMTPTTLYPIASTSKAMTATLIGMLVDDGLLEWDTPVQTYLPTFRLKDPIAGAQATLRDLLTMRTGLPRHDWMWQGCPMSRAELVRRLQHLEPFAPFRDRYHYNNLSVTAAGHIAEVVTGSTWEALLRERLLAPLEMNATAFEARSLGEVAVAYHENRERELTVTQPLLSGVTGPSGGSIHSSVHDMTRWMAFNLDGGHGGDRKLIRHETLKMIQSPQIVVGPDPLGCPAPNSLYALGWFSDRYHGHTRLWHGGYLNDVNSDVSLFPDDDLGIVTFTNFGVPVPASARLINQMAFDLVMGLKSGDDWQLKFEQYEASIIATSARYKAAPRLVGSAPSHALGEYAGVYTHPGYGTVEIEVDQTQLVFRRHSRDSLILPLEHWHFDVWVARDREPFHLHELNPFDRVNGLAFGMRVDGQIDSLSLQLEPTVPRIRFERQPGITPERR